MYLRNRIHLMVSGKKEISIPEDSARSGGLKDVRFKGWDGATHAFDTGGDGWAVSESALTHSDGRRLKRLTAHRAFWFGWQAQFPETRLVK